MPTIHPATYSAELVAPIAALLTARTRPGGSLLDPFGGLGHRLAEIAALADLRPTAIEIEPGYFTAGATHPCVVLGDSTSLPYADDSFDAAVTSPVYPNGMSDNFIAADTSVRHTYIHRLRAHVGSDYVLHDNNPAAYTPRRSLGALRRFYGVHERVWAEVHRLLAPGAPFVVNVKDTLSVDFTQDTWDQLLAAGFRIDACETIDVRGLNHGKNHERKHRQEHLIVAIKDDGPSIPFPG